MNLDWLIRKFKSYEIASADGTAIAAAAALKDFAGQVSAKSPKGLLDELLQTTHGLRDARQSSAALQNCLDAIEAARQNAYIEKRSLDVMRKQIIEACDGFVVRIAKAKERIAEIGAKRIRSGDTLLTLCRSTTVLSILKTVAAQGLYDALQLLKAIAILIEPVLPTTAESLWHQLGQAGDVHQTRVGDCLVPLKPGTTLHKPELLFQKIPDEIIQRMTAVFKERIEKALDKSTP